MALIVLGDSHTIFSFGGVAEAKIYHVPGVTMHRAARDGISSVIPEHCQLHDDDVLVLSLGEIDSRAQIPKHARLNDRSTIEEVDALCDRFSVALSDFKNNCNSRVAISCIIPFNPYTLSHKYYETSEDAAQEARAIRDRMNFRLKRMGVPFLDVGPDFGYPDGTLIPSMSDGSLHLDPRQSAPIIRELTRAFGGPYTHMDPPWPNAFPRAETSKKEQRRRVRKEIERGAKQAFLLAPGARTLRSLYKKLRGSTRTFGKSG